MRVAQTAAKGINHMLQFNGPPSEEPPGCSSVNPNKQWLETISVASLPLLQQSHTDTGHYTQAHLSRRAKWQLRPLCVCLVTFDQFLLTTYEGVRNVKRKQTSGSDQRGSPVFLQHTLRWDQAEAWWHFKDGPDGKWDCVRQSGKCHWGNRSTLLIKKDVIKKREGEKKHKRGYWFLFLCNTERENQICYFTICIWFLHFWPLFQAIWNHETTPTYLSLKLNISVTQLFSLNRRHNWLSGVEDVCPTHHALNYFIAFYLFVVYAADASLQVRQAQQQRSDWI